MANPLTQYLKDTRGELNHVAWPTRTQTIVYAVLVAAISVGLAVYLGAFDFLFRAGLAQFIDSLPANSSAPAAQTANASATPLVQGSPIQITQTPVSQTTTK